MSRQTIDHKGGPIKDQIWKLLIYAGQQMHETQIKIEKVREALEEFVIQKKGGRGLRRKITFAG